MKQFWISTLKSSQLEIISRIEKCTENSVKSQISENYHVEITIISGIIEMIGNK